MPNTNTNTNTLYQYSLISALLQGICTDGLSASSLTHHGTHGIGTLAELDGEMIMLDDEAYHFRTTSSSSLSDIQVRRLDTTDRIPFAMLTNFQPTHHYNITTPLTINALRTQTLAPLLTTKKNHFLSVRIDAHFSALTLRIIPRRTAPHETLADLADRQVVTSLEATTGSLFGFWSPRYVAGIGVAGFHLHYVAEDRRTGGHVLDFTAEVGGTVDVAIIDRVEVELPDTKEFGEVAVEVPVGDAVQRAEGGGE
ncbi:acetolactate decarboxylase [Aspergillus homomorphus CBS 101889]|uniref:Alpha-acetolactate decarboxylase n=1 Tax=Aspergillus homomorphus (strain CBS 101889) TaxID=1450537 RepID=A0A395I6B5_ASPHC|nr:alpha-acetolactate decarboxylase [Aspergillus homomorphus CBS 101889]RAL15792.1 alpha-acetolactate decarboxylase [Aspergillus homomorphus CBS 101889]